MNTHWHKQLRRSRVAAASSRRRGRAAAASATRRNVLKTLAARVRRDEAFFGVASRAFRFFRLAQQRIAAVHCEHVARDSQRWFSVCYG